MRLKTFTAPTTVEAMQMVRREMGEDAIIVSTNRDADSGAVRVTAAVEDFSDIPPAFEASEEEKRLDTEAVIRQAMNNHGVPPQLTNRLTDMAADVKAENPTMAFAGALDARFEFKPLLESGEGKPIMLVGPPGAGKTITVAKLAARSALSGFGVRVATVDTKRAGGIEQLAAFTRILKLELNTIVNEEAMIEAARSWHGNDPVYIDTMGTNPFSDTDMETLKQFIAAAGAEPILVLAAGGDALESADIAASFAAIDATRLLVTRLDMARRLGGVLTAAEAGSLKFSDVSITPQVADGLSPINPVSLARLIMPHATKPAEISETSILTEATL